MNKEIEEYYYKNKKSSIVRTYTHEEENNYYSFICKKISEKYPKIVNFHEIYDFIKDKGNIVTLNLKQRYGSYDEKNDIVEINHFLNRITTVLFHEVVHKISYLIGKGKIKNLARVYREAGTEIITSNSLKTKDCIGYIFSNLWAKFPNTITSYYLDTVLVNQINEAIGGQELEKSILKGNDDFNKKLEEFYGKENAEKLTKEMKKNSENFSYYSKFYKVLNDKKKSEYSEKLKSGIDVVQEIVLHTFDKKIEDVKTAAQANKILKELLEFSDFRIRTLSADKKLKDDKFQEYFEFVKKQFKEKFPEDVFNQKFDPNDWIKKYTELEEIVQIPKEEYEQIKQESKKREKEYKKEKFRKFLNKIGIGKKIDELPEGNKKEVKLNKIDFKFDSTSSSNNSSNSGTSVITSDTKKRKNGVQPSLSGDETEK